MTANAHLRTSRFAFALIMLGCASLATAQEKKVKPYTFKGTRNQRFGEILVIGKKGIEIYNTIGLNDCPARLWDAMDLEKLKKKFGAVKIEKNGPHYWMMDEQTVQLGETASFGGLKARWAAIVDPALIKKEAKGTKPYTIFNPSKTQRMVYFKGKPVYELVDPEGHAYVLQAREEKFAIESLAKLGEKMKQLPKGWKYRTRILREDLILDLKSDQKIYGVGDEFHQYYTRIPKK